MPLVVGMDEVGYGPLLGPLVISSVVAHMENPDCDLWKECSRAVKKDKEPKRSRKLTVCDSKKLFSQQAGIKSLEATALPFILMQNKVAMPTYTSILQKHSLDNMAWYPWYNKDIPLPLELDVNSISQKVVMLKETFDGKGIQIVDVKFIFLEPSQFNIGINTTGNKAVLLFSQTSKLIKAILSSHADNDVIFHIGKQGGKDFYLADIVKEFSQAGVMARREGESHSEYTLQFAQRRVTLNFLVDAEDKHFLIALASIIGKYIRELSMKLFNQYWCGVVEGLRPTAGYGKDARRFVEEIKPWLAKTQNAVPDFIRIR